MKRDYLKMVKLGRSLPAQGEGRPSVKLAILSDNSTQQLANVLRAELWEEGFFPEIYAGEIDSIAMEVWDEGSALHQFKSQYVWLNLCSLAYRERFYQAAPESKEGLPQAYAEEVSGLVAALAQRGCQVIVNTLAAPLERMFGNYSVQTLHSLHGSIAEANRRLVEMVKQDSQCLLNDVAFLAARLGLETWYDERLWAHSKYMCAPAGFMPLAESVAAIVRVTRGRLAKCLVLDLDNTLWGGVIGDDGLEGIELGGMGPGESFQRFQHYLLQLKARGILLAVCSKNNEENARLPFQKHSAMVLREADIAVFVANWDAKSANIEQISKILNIGADSLVFVDDNPFERNEVRQGRPSVQVPELPEDPADCPAFLEAAGYFETVTFSEDDQKRTQMYREGAQRATLQTGAKNIQQYLESLEMIIACEPFDPQHLPRIAQLLQRSNQFNLRTQRFSEGRCKEMMESPEEFPCFHINLRDKVGDYGLISVVCTQRSGDRLEILEYVMSCRVLNRGVEQYVITFLANYCKQHGLTTLRGEYLVTEKNRMVSEFYGQFGFAKIAASDAGSAWELAVAEFVPPKVFLKSANL